jgi:hypothetical protein
MPTYMAHACMVIRGFIQTLLSVTDGTALPSLSSIGFVQTLLLDPRVLTIFRGGGLYAGHSPYW